MTKRIEKVRKRNEREVSFSESKIADAIYKAAQAVGGEDREMADELASVVTMFLEQEFAGDVPGIEDIQDVVEKVLIETGHAATAKAYILYRCGSPFARAPCPRTSRSWWTLGRGTSYCLGIAGASSRRSWARPTSMRNSPTRSPTPSR